MTHSHALRGVSTVLASAEGNTIRRALRLARLPSPRRVGGVLAAIDVVVLIMPRFLIDRQPNPGRPLVSAVLFFSVCAVILGFFLLFPANSPPPPETLHAQGAVACTECPGPVECPEPPPCECPASPEGEATAAAIQQCPECADCAECPQCPDQSPQAPADCVCPEPGAPAQSSETLSFSSAGAKGDQAIQCCLTYDTAYAALVKTPKQSQEDKTSTFDPAILERVINYVPKLPQRAVQRGVFSIGEPARMRRFVKKLLSGEHVSIASVGGSVTAGQGAIYGNGYVHYFHTWVNQTSPNMVHTLKNGAFGGSTSALFSVCTNTVVPEDADFVTVEFAINDPMESGGGHEFMNTVERRSFERMLRKLLDLPNRPAVVLLNSYAWFASKLNGQDGEERGKFHRSAESALSTFGQYYALPILSLRSAVYRFMDEGLPGYQVNKYRRENEKDTVEENLFFYDEVHPQDAKLGTGHRMIMDLLVSLIKVTTTDLLLNPPNEEDNQIAQEPLIEPMLEGNYQKKTASCYLQRDAEKVVVQQEGFEFKNERPEAQTVNTEKWGWIAEKPGSYVVLEVDTRSEGEGDARSLLYLGYLRSYQHMGKASVECVANCECEKTEIDGHWETQVSLTELHHFEVSPAEKCQVRVTVLNETSSGEHKVKVSGVMVAGMQVAIQGAYLGVQVELISST